MAITPRRALTMVEPRFSPDVATGRDLLYMGGPVDYAEHELGTAWQHWPDWSPNHELDVYCPRCRCSGLADDAIIDQNRWALHSARLAILDLRSHSIGTPIEMYWRLWEANRSAILIAKPGSVFIQYTAAHYPAIVVADEYAAWREAMRILG